MTAPWPCSTCGEPGVRNLGTRGYCASHLADLYRMISHATWMEVGGGVGLPELARPDHAPGCFELSCSACKATWVGAAFSRCPWCVETLERMQRWTATALLRPELPDADDARRAAALEAWAGRLARGVTAELITEQEARRAWNREVGRAVA